MPENQTDLPLDALSHSGSPPAPELRDEIAAAFGLPLGERVHVSFRDSQIDAIAGKLELVVAPAYPWNPREPLALRVAGFTFSSRDIERWTRV